MKIQKQRAFSTNCNFKFRSFTGLVAVARYSGDTGQQQCFENPSQPCDQEKKYLTHLQTWSRKWTHSSILAWKIPWREEPGGIYPWGHRVRHDWAHTHTHTHTLKTILYQHNRCVFHFQSVSSVAQLCPTLCDPMDRSTPGLPVHHQLPEFTQTHVHWVGNVIQPSHPLSSPSPPALKLSQHQGLFKWVSSSHQVAKVLEFQLHFHFQYSI